MSDRDTSVRALRELVRPFVDQRDWQQFHAPQNIHMAFGLVSAWPGGSAPGIGLPRQASHDMSRTAPWT